MNIVWIIDKDGSEYPLKVLFESMNDAFKYKEKMKSRYPEYLFYHTTGINVPIEDRKSLNEIIKDV